MLLKRQVQTAAISVAYAGSRCVGSFRFAGRLALAISLDPLDSQSHFAALDYLYVSS